MQILADQQIDHPTLQVLGNRYTVAMPAGEKFQFSDGDEQTFIRLFERQVAQVPHAVAFVFGQKQLTYNELNERANQLAHYLVRLGIKEDSLVPICIERSLEMMIGVLGIIKAGAAYVPIDPEYPSERINFILEDTKAGICVSNAKHQSKLYSSNREVVTLDDGLPELAEQPKANLPLSILPGHLCYVIYTSGSTGTPKGVLIEHKSLLNYLLYCKGEYLSEKATRAASFIHLSYTFDASLTAMFVPLLAGRLSVIGSRNGLEAFEDVNLLKFSPYDFLKITPSHIPFLEALLKKKLVVGKLIMGGEALTLNQLNYLKKNNVDLTIVNEYGPTEATVGCTTHSLNLAGHSDNFSDCVSIGKPISGAQIYIVGENNELVVDGTVGEIYIGGIGVAKGYLNRPEINASKFVSSPLGEGVLYKSGDNGKWLPDGTLEYCGRMDEQVKISGYRIELGEVEAALRKHPFIKNTVVIAREHFATKALIAYMISDPDNSPDAKAVESFLHERLPAYMVPSAYVFLDKFPLTPNGKIDRHALPPPLGKVLSRENFEEPKNDIEAKLKAIWQECLNVSPIGVHDNFFELGGGSLQAAIIFAKIRHITGKDLSISTLFTANTIEQLASVISDDQLAVRRSSLVPIQALGSKTPLFCMHAGAGPVLFYHNLSAHLGLDQPFYGLQARGLNGEGVPHTTIEDMAKYYISEIRRIQPEGPYNLAGYCLGGILAFEMGRQLVNEGQRIGLLATMNGVSPLYPSSSEDNEEEEHHLRNFISLFTSNFVKYINGFRNLSMKQKVILLLKLLLKPFIGKRKRQKLRKALYQLYISRNRPLPLFLRELYFLETNVDLVKAYKPLPYDGDLLILRSPGIYPEPNLGWEPLVNGEIVTLDISGEHKNRREIINEPYVRETAATLKKYLDR